ncbi:hypothetical protein PtB15_2B596 [Puccinia triticina]|nr:hypothetical protein PtB15_2B596 [Puccinia triticina]
MRAGTPVKWTALRLGGALTQSQETFRRRLEGAFILVGSRPRGGFQSASETTWLRRRFEGSLRAPSYRRAVVS